jgi:hypothetical protein
MTETLAVVESILDIGASDWNRCASGGTGELNPFLAHEFLSALEQSGCATPQTGWAPRHLVLKDNGRIAGLVPAYLKPHSYGEYVFDHGWADAIHRAGGNYYPKLQVSVPFTPVTGPRLLAETAHTKSAMALHLQHLCQQQAASSVHITFAEDADGAILEEHGWLKRQDIQFHWHNAGYADFEGFLGSLSSSKRKNIRKERGSFAAAGIEFEWQTGASLREVHWDHFYEFYCDTGNRKWGSPYLNRTFFSLINERMASQILLVLARRNGRYIAGALNFIGQNTLYGRNWGCIENHPFLHFEVCYYQAIDFAIAHHMQTVEAGAQGEHKLARGYLPAKTTSFHYIRHKGLARAVADYLVHERERVDESQTILSEHSPFRRRSGDDHDL